MTAILDLPTGRAFLRSPFCPLPDGRLGWYQRGFNDCQRAAIATLLRIRYEDAPPLIDVDGRELDDAEAESMTKADELATWQSVFAWAVRAGWGVRFHDATAAASRGDWIGVEQPGEDGFRHVVVCRGSRIVFNPSDGWVMPPGAELAPVGPLAYGITFEPIGGEQAAPPADLPRRLRILIDNGSADPQKSLLYAIRSNGRGDGGDPMAVECESLTPLGGAAVATLSGASGGGSNNVVQHTNLSTQWVALLEGRFSHVGPHRVWLRVHDPATTAGNVKLRLEWFSGDPTRPTQNEIVETTVAANFGLIDLGGVMPRRARSGPQSLRLRVLARAETAGADISLDKLYILPTGEGYGRIVASDELPAPTAFSALSEFNTESGAITGDAAAIGGNWAVLTGSDTNDFDVAAGVATRAAVSDSGSPVLGRAVGFPNLNMGPTAAEVDFRASASVGVTQQGLLLRVVNNLNYLSVVWDHGIERVIVTKVIAGTGTFLHDSPGPAIDVTETHRLRAVVDGGSWMVALDGTIVARGEDADVASTLATGDVYLYDGKGNSSACTRTYDNFAVWVPEIDYALDGTAELRTDGYWRQSSSGMAPAVPLGDLPRMPLGGGEGRDIEVLIKSSEGDLGALPDSGRDAPSVRIAYRPSWLFPPRS